jgi:hypothetical protein
MSEPRAPAQIEWLIEAIGVDAALLVIEAHGGTQLHIPSGVGSSPPAVRQRFEQRFGKETTKALIRNFGGGVIHVPICAQWRTELYSARNVPHVEIARRLGCTVSTVWRRLNRDKWQSTFQQLDLGV